MHFLEEDNITSCGSGSTLSTCLKSRKKNTHVQLTFAENVTRVYLTNIPLDSNLNCITALVMPGALHARLFLYLLRKYARNEGLIVYKLLKKQQLIL